MAELTEQQKLEIHNKIYQAGKGMIPVQELTYAASQLCKDNSEANQVEVLRNLKQFSMPGVATSTSTVENIASEAIRDAVDRNQDIVAAMEETGVPEYSISEDHIFKAISSGTISVGNIVSIGKYPQTEEAISDETKKTPVEWYIIKTDNENHKALLWTKDALAYMPWTNSINNTQSLLYENSNYYAFCDSFYNTAFSEQEKDIILTSSNLGNMVSSGNDSGELNNVKVFLLSASEINTINTLGSPFNCCYLTEYGEANAASSVLKTQNHGYMVYTATRTSGSSLRSQFDMSLKVNSTTEQQSFDGQKNKSSLKAVRLAMWVSI